RLRFDHFDFKDETCQPIRLRLCWSHVVVSNTNKVRLLLDAIADALLLMKHCTLPITEFERASSVVHWCSSLFSSLLSITESLSYPSKFRKVIIANIIWFQSPMEKAQSSKELMNAKDIFQGDKSICPECNVGLMAPKNLYAHVRDVHYWQEKEVIALKAAYKRSKSNEETELPCECGQIFFSKRGLLTHQQKVHGLDHESGWVVCPECEKRFTRYSSLANHCRDYHHDSVPGQDYSVIKGQMQNWQEFEDWKRAKELATRTNFVIRRTYETMEGRTIIFVCQRSRGTGKDVDVLAKRQRSRISRRFNSHCTAFLNVIRLDDGTVQYFGCMGHIGHAVTTATLPLPSEDEDIVEMLESGLPPSVVMHCCPVCGKNRGRRSFAIFSYGRPSQVVLLSCLLRYKIIGMRRATSVCVVMRNTKQHRSRICKDHFIQTAFFLGLEVEQLLGHFPFNGISGVPTNVIEDFLTHVRMFSSLIDDTVSIEEKDVVTLFNDCLVAYFKDVVKELFYAEKREAQECTDASSPSTSTGRPVSPIPKDKRRSVCGGLLPQPPDAATCSSSPTLDFDSSIEQSCFDRIKVENGKSPSRDVDVADEILFNLSSHSLSFLKQDSSEHECGPTSEMLQCSLCGRVRPRKRLKAAPTDPLQNKMLFSCLVRDKMPSNVALRFYEENCSGRATVCKFHYAQAAYCIGDQVRRRPEEKYPVTGLGNVPDDILRNIVDLIRSYGIVIEKEFSVDSVINFYNLCRSKFCPNAESDDEIQFQNGCSSGPIAPTSATKHEEKDVPGGSESPWAEVKEEVDDRPPDPDACSSLTEERDEQDAEWMSVNKKLNKSKEGAADGIRKAMLKSDPNKSFRELAKEVFSSPPTKKKRGEGSFLKVEDTLDESLRQEQEAFSRLEICSSLYLRNKLKGFLDRIVVYEEEWIIYDHKNPFTRKPSKNPVSATAGIATEDTKPKESILSKRKALLTVWWSSSGVILHKVLTRSPRQVGRAFASYIHHMKRNLIRQQLSLALGPAPIFLYDNSSGYLTNSMVETLCRFGFECLPYPCTTPMLSPHANYISSNFANYLSDKKEIEDLSKAFCDFVESKSPSFFKDGLSELPVRWERCINLRGF
ncbi:hypothetical protein V3C99_006528, partial [Haemonchus contortus]